MSQTAYAISQLHQPVGSWVFDVSVCERFSLRLTDG